MELKAPHLPPATPNTLVWINSSIRIVLTIDAIENDGNRIME